MIESKGKRIRVHRKAWLYFYGNVPNQYILHSCDNRRCCNPKHLREGTNDDNMQDMWERKRHSFGSKVYCAKLKECDVLAIKSLIDGGEALTRISSRFNVSTSAISDIKNGVTWKHV